MAIYWFSVARSLQWDEFVGRSPDFASEVVKAKTEAEGIEKMTMRILSVAGAESDVGERLSEPLTHEEAAEWQKSAAGTLYPVCVDIRTGLSAYSRTSCSGGRLCWKRRP